MFAVHKIIITSKKIKIMETLESRIAKRLGLTEKHVKQYLFVFGPRMMRLALLKK